MSARAPGRFALVVATAMALATALALAIPAAAPAQQPAEHQRAAQQADGPAQQADGPAQRQFPADEDLELMLRYLVEDGEAPGIVLGILEADGARRIVSYGDAGPEALPLGPKSVFEMGSITKVFTGILLADMVDRGEVSLSDPVAMHLPAEVTVPSRNGREITLLDLATHRSSLPRMPDNMVRQGAEAYPSYAIEDLYTFLSTHELRRDIGSEYEYSNIAVALLGHALERVAGVPYEELLRERLLDPLGMRMSSTRVEGEMRRWMTRGHGERGGPAPYRNFPNLPGMGALRSNAEDMLTFLEANTGEPGSRLERVMRTAQEARAPINDRGDVGLNWQVRRIGDREFLTHGGATAGYNTRIILDPELRVAAVLLTNTSEFGDDIDVDFLRRGPPLALAEVDVSPALLETYTGLYGATPAEAMAVRLEPEGWLTVQAPGNVRFRLYADSDTSFFVKRTPWRFTFTRDVAGEVVGLVGDFEGTERRAGRVAGEVRPPRVVAGNGAADLPLTREEVGRYEGMYAVAVGARARELRVFIEEGRLHARLEGQPPFRMLYQGDHEFRLATTADVRVVFTIDAGRAESVAIHQAGGVYRGTRNP